MSELCSRSTVVEGTPLWLSLRWGTRNRPHEWLVPLHLQKKGVCSYAMGNMQRRFTHSAVC